jgi:hypothetical protein
MAETDKQFEVVVSVQFAPSYKREFIRQRVIIRHSSFVKELSVQLWSVNQWTTEAEEATDS